MTAAIAAASPVRKCQPLAAAGLPYLSRYVFFAAAACSAVSFGSKLTVTTSNSRPASNDRVLSALARPLSESVQSIGQP